MVIDHGVINAQIENILEHYDKTIIDPNMKIYLETLYKHKSDIKMKDTEYSFKDNVLLLKSSAFEIKLDMNLNIAAQSSIKMNKDLFSELTLFGLNFTPYILEIK